jgi:hypothetical protein
MSPEPLRPVPDHDPVPDPVEPVDPFDTSSLYGLNAPIGAQVFRSAIPARAPRKHEFFRVCPDPAYTVVGLSLSVEIDGREELCWLSPPLVSAAVAANAEPAPMQVFTVMVHPDLLILWPQKLPNEANGRSGSSWHYSGLRIAAMAHEQWVRRIANRSTNVYDWAAPVGDLGEPTWPTEPMRDLMALAFTGDRLIDRIDHPVLRRLRGEP